MHPFRAITVFGALAAIAGVAAGVTPAEATATTATATATTAAPVPVVEIAPELNGLPVDSAEYRSAQTRFESSSSALATTTALVASTATELSQLATQDTRLTAELASETARKKDATIAIVQARAGLRALAVDRYVQGENDLAATDDVNVATELLGQRALKQAVGEEQAIKLHRSLDARLDAINGVRDALVARITTRQRLFAVQATHDGAVTEETRLTQEVATRQGDLERARVTATVVSEDFALVALDAYWKAARTLAAQKPACGLPWWALAGITRSESKHGTYGGARLLADGDVDRTIVGIPLDGTNATELIPDTDGGAYDGDPTYDRAVGPMQFIPSTWRRWARDGNGDGTANPSNIYDAALAAASYLCANGPMETDDQMRRGFLSYNHSDAYADTVLNYAKVYSRFQIPARQ